MKTSVQSAQEYSYGEKAVGLYIFKTFLNFWINHMNIKKKEQKPKIKTLRGYTEFDAKTVHTVA